jgi:hypothetical protein
MLALQDTRLPKCGSDRLMSEKSFEYSRAFDSEVVFESYGVRVKIQATDPELLQDGVHVAKRALLDRIKILDSKDADHTFGIAADEDGTKFLFLDGEQISYDNTRKRFYKFFNGILRIVVAEHAQGAVFIHAGVVGWRGKAIVIPGNSFEGKTTLVAELVKNGADYYSDEYAVLDEYGMCHAFPRDLSIRDSQFREEDVPVSAFGGRIGVDPIPVGAVLLTRFDVNAEWNPERLTVGQGIMEIIPHTIPRIFNTEFSLKVLNTAVSDAIILKSPRGEAREFAIKLLSFFDNFY